MKHTAEAVIIGGGIVVCAMAHYLYRKEGSCIVFVAVPYKHSPAQVTRRNVEFPVSFEQ